MIKIIKEGIKPKKYKDIYSHTCTNCTCEFEFEEDDCTSVRHEKHIDGAYTGYIKCPFCSERLFIDFKTAKSRKEEIIEEKPINPINIYTDDFYQWSPAQCKCPRCGSSDTLMSDSFKLTMLLPQYDFKCNDCGYRWYGPKQTQTNTKPNDPLDNEHCNKCPNKSEIGDACYICPHWPYKVTCNTEAKK